jgi:hypothetical protein
VTALLVAAILSLSPALSNATAQRYAADIASAAEGDLDMAWALTATQFEESHFRGDIESCAVTGDGGAAVTAWQLHRHWWAGYSQAELCASNRLASSLAASALTVLSHRTGGMVGALRGYIGSRPGDPRSVRRIQLYRKLRGTP